MVSSTDQFITFSLFAKENSFLYLTAPALIRNVRGNENTEADNVVGNNIIEANVIKNELHFGHDNTLLESNTDDCTSISSQESIDQIFIGS